MRADAAIVTEPTELEVVVAHKGFVWSEVEVTGRAAHGSRPDPGRRRDRQGRAGARRGSASSTRAGARGRTRCSAAARCTRR